MHCLFSAPVPFDGTDGDLKKGIIFHEDKKILLAEKFINIQFLLPFPQFDIFIKDELRNITNTLHSMWKMPTFFCNLQFTNVSMEDFQVHWLVNEVQKEVSLAETAIINLRKEVASLLSPPIQSPSSNRSKRALPLAPIALGAIGLFGSGVAMGSGDCGLMGILGNCQARENKEAINRMFTAQSQLFENFEHLRTVTNDKFYIVSRELQSIYDVQNQMAEIQNANWQLISEQLETFRQDIHEMRNCDQLLFTRQQINFNFDPVASLLALFYSNIKAYSAALFAYRLNLLNSVPALLNKYVPMSLLTRDSLERVLQKVGDIQFNSDDRLTLAIPFNDIMSYYDAQLLQDVVTLEKGLFLTMSIPLASKQTVMTIYQAIPIPMPQPDEDIALLWDIESEYLAVSADARETALLSHRDIGHCIGSSRYSICRQGIATEGLYSSCLSLLFFGNLVQAMQVCNVKPYQLPTTERALNLRYGIWLIVSASPNFQLRRSQMTSLQPAHSSTVDGCKICIVTLGCGEQLSGPNLHLRSDLDSCSLLPAVTVNVLLPDPLAAVLSTLPSVAELPFYNTKTSAAIDLLKSIKHDIKYINNPSRANDSLFALAQPIAAKMVQMKSPFLREINKASTFTTTLLIGVCSFLISMILHALLTLLLHRCKSLHRFKPFSFFDTENKEKVSLKPVLSAPLEKIDYFRTHKDNHWRDKCIYLPEETVTNMHMNSSMYASPSFM